MTGSAGPHDHPPFDRLAEPDLQGVALNQGVGRDEAQLSASIEQGVCPQDEPTCKVRTASSSGALPALQPREIVTTECAGHLLAAEERWVADDGVEPHNATCEGLRKGNRPVERRATSLALGRSRVQKPS